MIRGNLAYWLGAIALGVSLSGPQGAAANEYYRWIDADGNPVHSDRPPPTGTPYEVISVKTSKVRQVREDEDRAATPSGTAADDEAQQRASAYRTQPAIEKDPERCAQAQENMTTLENAPRRSARPTWPPRSPTSTPTARKTRRQHRSAPPHPPHPPAPYHPERTHPRGCAAPAGFPAPAGLPASAAARRTPGRNRPTPGAP